jgi:hypothetical protein
MQGTVSSHRHITTEAAGAGTRDSFQLAGLLALLFCLGVAGSGLAWLIKPASPNGAALDGAGWEGRRLVAQMLWLKTHAVLHAGVEEREARPGEETTRANEIHSHGSDGGRSEHPGEDAHGSCEHPGGCEHDGEESHEDEGGQGAHVLAVPPAREDWRGILGDLERSIKPYTDANGRPYSKDADQTVPFYRMVTWADPRFIQGYTVGAMFICRSGRYADRAIAYLHEGERYNPASFEIQMELGHYYLVYKKDYPAAEKHLLRALALVPRDRRLTEMEEEARTDAYRWLALNYQQWEKPQHAVRIAREGLRVLGEDPTLRRIIKDQGRK